MPAIGITGGISTGKTSFCQSLRAIIPSARFFDADQAAHQLADLDPEGKNEIRAEFGAEVFTGDGHLNREKLRAIVFVSATKTRALEHILHPRIRPQSSVKPEQHR